MGWLGRDEFEDYLCTNEDKPLAAAGGGGWWRWSYLYIILLVLIVAFIIYAVDVAHPKAQIVNGTTVGGNVECKFINGNPDMNCTPGITMPVPKEGLCSPTYPIPPLDDNTIMTVFRTYGITDTAGWDIQHYMPQELGGSNAIENLYPMPKDPRPGFEERNMATKKLLELLCNGKIPLEAAQYMITHDWQSNKGLYGE